MDQLRFAATLSAALGCGLIAGVFFAFSVCVMRALARLPTHEGIAAMQSINVVILNPVFLGVFLGTAIACLVVLLVSFARWQAPGSAYALFGGVLYLAGALLVTRVCNIPRNNRLAAVAPADPRSAKIWSEYLREWTAWNHVRTLASLGAASALTMALGR
jgi:uncharacterized membrane protein